MARIIKCLLVLVLFFNYGLDVSAQQIQRHWTMVWSDEFDYVGSPDPSKWNFEEGFKRNNELQWYLPQNATVKNQLLIIEGRKDSFKNPIYDSKSRDWRKNRKMVNYTASSITTKDKFSFKYGRLEVRAKIPTSSGAWPAIWTLGVDMPWPSNGEVDLMELYKINGQQTILANAAWGKDREFDAAWRSTHHPYARFTAKDPQWSEKFHIWRMDWDSTSIKLYLDDELLNEVVLKDTYNGTIGSGTNPFMQPHYVLLNLAMGANGGEIDDKLLPMRYEIDYVRVFQQLDQPQTSIKPGQLWLDNEGNHINAHGGGLVYHNNKYYWFGEHKNYFDCSAQVGVMCYSSDDLVNWTNEGVALQVSDDVNSPITRGCVLERPKVIYNKKTKKFVMWFHLELKGQGYKAALAGIAQSDKVTGPYEFIKATRANAGKLPLNVTKKEYSAIPNNYQDYTAWSPQWKNEMPKGLLLKRDMDGGQMSRDMTLFVDDDGKAYHIFSSEDNQTLHIAQLTPDYLSHSGKYARVAPGDANEAPALFKKDGEYWLITSGCTGWDPNEARMFRAKNIFGPWEQYSNPCIGDDADITFGSQSTYIQQVGGKKNAYIFMADRWTPDFPYEGRYVWLPIQFKSDVPFLEWFKEWDLNFFE